MESSIKVIQIFLVMMMTSALMIRGVDSVAVLTAERTESKFPTPRRVVSVSYDGRDTAYIVGGHSGRSEREILKYSLSADTLTLVGELPEGLYQTFAGNDGNGSHYVVGGGVSNRTSRVYRFVEGNEASVDLVGTLPSHFGQWFFSLPGQASNKNVLHLIQNSDTLRPSIYEVSVNELSITREIPLPLLNGYERLRVEGAVYTDGGNCILVFGEFYSEDAPLTTTVAVKYDLEQLRTELVVMPPMSSWTQGLYPSSDGRNLVFLFGSYENNLGFYRYDISRNESVYFEVAGVKNDSSTLFWLTTTLYVPSLNRLYIFGGHEESPTGSSMREEIWYVDLDPIGTPMPTTTLMPPTTPMSPDLFTCEGRGDGFYPNPLDCSKYIGCHNGGEMTHYQCPNPLLFDPNMKTCNLPSFVDCELSCEGKLDGFYPHPQDCALYVICNAYQAHVFRCPGDLLFNRESSQCDVPENVNC